MKKLFALVPLILLCLMPTASAGLIDAINGPDKPPIAVVVFTNKEVLDDSKLVSEIRSGLKTKFKEATNIAIYGDDQSKSSEFLEFIERVKTDPVNEKGIRVISNDALAQYGRETNSKYVILVVITHFNSVVYGNGDIKANISVIDVATKKHVEYLNWYKEGASWKSGAEYLLRKFISDFNWAAPAGAAGDKPAASQSEGKRPAVIVLLSDAILEKPELVEKIRTTVSTKFKVRDVPIYVDERPKSPEFLEFIGLVVSDSAKQQTFVLKKERMVEYGKNANSSPLIVIMINTVAKNGYYSYHLKADIYVIDPETNKYLSNVVYDTGDDVRRQDGVEFLLNKIQNDFVIP
ncbi:MAG: hypothetical protein P4N59_08135 [Negativicutes bacterium]|nr:hypothetical protein [Negativicutes bacterium]